MNSILSTRQRSKSGESNFEMFETYPSPKSKNSDDNAEICDSDDDIIFPPSPDVDLCARSVKRSQVKRRRVSWDKTADIEARLADSPGFRAKFATPENKRHKSQIEAVTPPPPPPWWTSASSRCPPAPTSPCSASSCLSRPGSS